MLWKDFIFSIFCDVSCYALERLTEDESFSHVTNHSLTNQTDAYYIDSVFINMNSIYCFNGLTVYDSSNYSIIPFNSQFSQSNWFPVIFLPYWISFFHTQAFLNEKIWLILSTRNCLLFRWLKVEKGKEEKYVLMKNYEQKLFYIVKCALMNHDQGCI